MNINIAQTLEKPTVTRGRRKRRRRQIRTICHIAILVAFLSSGSYFIYLNVVLLNRLWQYKVVPMIAGINWTSVDWSAALNVAAGGFSLVGIVCGFWVYFRSSNIVKGLLFVCFTYCYLYLCYISLLIVRSFFDVDLWTISSLSVISMLVYKDFCVHCFRSGEKIYSFNKKDLGR